MPWRNAMKRRFMGKLIHFLYRSLLLLFSSCMFLVFISLLGVKRVSGGYVKCFPMRDNSVLFYLINMKNISSPIIANLNPWY